MRGAGTGRCRSGEPQVRGSPRGTAEFWATERAGELGWELLKGSVKSPGSLGCLGDKVRALRQPEQDALTPQGKTDRAAAEPQGTASVQWHQDGTDIKD